MEANVSTESALLNEEQAAKYLGGVSLKHLYNLRTKAGLPYVRVGSRVMYRAESLLRWIADREVSVQD